MATFKATQKVTPFLWFDSNLEEAVNFYTSVFKNSEIIALNSIKDAHYGGNMVTATFRIEDQHFMALEGGPMFKFSPATSLYVNCANQDEVDYLWEKLTADGGKANRCGWLDDRFGITWQIIPELLGKLLYDPNPEKAKRVMNAMLQMIKIDCRLLQEAYDNE